jgi:hypothetical protein
VWPESRAVLCAARDGRVGWLPLLALDSASQSVGTASLRWRIAAAFHRNVCLIRATSGCPSPTDLKDENAVVGEYFACHTCATRWWCVVCVARAVTLGHQLQPLFAPPATTLCACGAGRAPGATAPPCCALHEEGIEPVLPTRSVRVVSPIVGAEWRVLFRRPDSRRGGERGAAQRIPSGARSARVYRRVVRDGGQRGGDDASVSV